jgi:hypothetical protein
MGWFGWIILISIILYIVFLISADHQKKCAWCDSKKIEFKTGKAGPLYWEYRNSDGSRDKRVKDNFQKASFASSYVCKECSAITDFNHIDSKDPDEGEKTWKRRLVKKGSGEQKGSNWEDEAFVRVNKKSANRKGESLDD